jgi:hypothetical protein
MVVVRRRQDAVSDAMAEAQRQAVGQHGGVRLFVDDDDGYLAWLAEHPDGFVVNTYRTPSLSYLRLHQAGCHTIAGNPARGTRWTADYAKVCGGRVELESSAATEPRGDPQPCPLCM